jgi:hypothetical protein
MRVPRSLKSDITYIRTLTKAVLDGITTVPETTADRASTPVLTTAVWTPTAIGAAIGALSAGLAKKHRYAYRAAAGGFLGSAIGFGAGVAWQSRDLTRAAARSTIQKVNRARDVRWLEKNPIDYA